MKKTSFTFFFLHIFIYHPHPSACVCTICATARVIAFNIGACTIVLMQGVIFFCLPIIISDVFDCKYCGIGHQPIRICMQFNGKMIHKTLWNVYKIWIDIDRSIIYYYLINIAENTLIRQKNTQCTHDKYLCLKCIRDHLLFVNNTRAYSRIEHNLDKGQAINSTSG